MQACKPHSEPKAWLDHNDSEHEKGRALRGLFHVTCYKNFKYGATITATFLGK